MIKQQPVSLAAQISHPEKKPKGKNFFKIDKLQATKAESDNEKWDFPSQVYETFSVWR